MFKRIGHIRAVILFTVSAAMLPVSSACVREDWSGCDPVLLIDFSYTRNPSATERFHDELTRLDLFIFDSEGRFVTGLADEQNRFPEGYAMQAQLPAEGDYTVVAVGNMNSSFEAGALLGYTQGCAEMIAGESRMADFRLFHKLAGSTCDEKIGDIFLGTAAVRGLKGDVTGRCTVPLTKNTSTIELTVSGFSSHAGIETDLRGRNASNKYDNSLDGDAPEISYAPFARDGGGTRLGLDYSVLRLTTAGTLPLTVFDNSTAAGDFDLIAEILKSPDYDTDEDLDREDTFKIDIKFDTSGSATIEVNGWQTTGSGGVVGRATEHSKL